AKTARGADCWSAEDLKILKCPLTLHCDEIKKICQDHCGTWLRIGLPGFIQNCVPNGVPPIDENDLTKGYDFSHSGFMVIFNGIYKLGLTLLAIVTLFMIVWGGYQYLTAMGGSRASEGKKIIYYAIGGMILGLSSWLILNVINDQLTEGYSNPLQFQRTIDEAKRRIEREAAREALRCGAGSDTACQGNSVENLCQMGGGTTGICKADANVAGNICSCLAHAACFPNCNGGDVGCQGQTCFVGDFPGQCVLVAGNATECRNTADACKTDCGASNTAIGLDCFGQSCDNDGNGQQGVCLDVTELGYWYSCQSKVFACNEDCGSILNMVAGCQGQPCTLTTGLLGTCSSTAVCHADCNNPLAEGYSCVFTDELGPHEGFCGRPDPNNSLLECLP
ncbi:MAG: pilin, partial [bacterium]|nr:pilin [bacterium]